jgi:hypothetical protein
MFPFSLRVAFRWAAAKETVLFVRGNYVGLIGLIIIDIDKDN